MTILFLFSKVWHCSSRKYIYFLVWIVWCCFIFYIITLFILTPYWIVIISLKSRKHTNTIIKRHTLYLVTALITKNTRWQDISRIISFIIYHHCEQQSRSFKISIFFSKNKLLNMTTYSKLFSVVIAIPCWAMIRFYWRLQWLSTL